MKVGALLRRYLDCTRGEDDADCGFACDCMQFLQSRINAGNRAKGCERAAVSRVYVIVLVKVSEFFMRLVGQRQAATPAFGCATIITYLITLAAVATAYRLTILSRWGVFII